jgi:hypothetical protein
MMPNNDITNIRFLDCNRQYILTLINLLKTEVDRLIMKIILYYFQHPFEY